MELEFKCPSCDKHISVRYLNVGDLVECQSCREHVVIPEDAVTPSDSTEEAQSEDTLDPSITEADTDIDAAIDVPLKRPSKVFTALVLLLAVGFILFVSVYAFMYFFSESRKIVRSTDEQVQITVPASWIKQPKLHSDAILAVTDSSKELYLIVLSENKSDFPDLNLNKYAQKTKDNLISNLKSPYTSVRRNLVVHNNKAIQYELRGLSDGIEVAYLHTSVEHRQNYYQILAWTLHSKFSDKKEHFQEIIQSFQAVPSEALWKVE